MDLTGGIHDDLNRLVFCPVCLIFAAWREVDKIKAVPTATKPFTVQGGHQTPFQNVPVDDVLIKSIQRAER